MLGISDQGEAASGTATSNWLWPGVPVVCKIHLSTISLGKTVNISVFYACSFLCGGYI